MDSRTRRRGCCARTCFTIPRLLVVFPRALLYIDMRTQSNGSACFRSEVPGWSLGGSHTRSISAAEAAHHNNENQVSNTITDTEAELRG